MAQKSIPAEQLEIVAFALVSKQEDLQTGDMYTEVEMDVWNQELMDAAFFPEEGGGQSFCDCCGHWVTYKCLVVHKPTMLGYRIGRQCAVNIAALGRSDFKAVSVALKQRMDGNRHMAKWLAANPQHAGIVAWGRYNKEQDIARNIIGKISMYGNISEKQIEFLYKLKAKSEEVREEEPVAVVPGPSGRITVKGVVLGLKTQSSDFGDTLKCLMRLEDNNKVWFTVPSACECRGLKGAILTITASWERSDKDEHFCFGKRPKLVSQEFATT